MAQTLAQIAKTDFDRVFRGQEAEEFFVGDKSFRGILFRRKIPFAFEEGGSPVTEHVLHASESLELRDVIRNTDDVEYEVGKIESETAGVFIYKVKLHVSA